MSRVRRSASKPRRPVSASAVLSALVLLIAACNSTTQVDTGARSGSANDGRGEEAGLAATADSAKNVLPAGGGTNASTKASGKRPRGPVARASGPSQRVPTAKGPPIQVGIFVWDNSAVAKTLGLTDTENEGPALRFKAARALIKAINAAGGVAGRRLVPIEASVDATSNNYNSGFEAACQQFTKDNRVAAVINDGLFYHQVFSACLAKAGVPMLNLSGVGSRIPDTQDLQNHPGLIGVNSASVDRKIKSIFNKAISAGFLRSGNKVGVFVEDCPYNVRAYERTLMPIAARHKITVSRFDANCAQNGFAEAGPLISNDQAAVLRFRSDGVDSVMFLTQLEGDMFLYFTQQADSQGWAPQYLLFHYPGDSATGEGYSANQLARMRIFGGMSLRDVTKPPAPPPAQAAARTSCLSMVRSQGVTVTRTTQSQVFQMCDGVFGLRAALANTRGLTGLRRIVAGIEQLGTSFVSTIDLDGATRFGNRRHDGMELTAVSTYKPKCSCFQYVTPARPIA